MTDNTKKTEPAEAVAVANCCQCGRIVDTREKADGGDDFGCETTDGRWTCSPECWEIATGATPPAPAVESAPADALDECDPAGRIRASLANDRRPAGWTEALALLFMAANGHNPEIVMFAKSFSEGAWQEIESEWPEFVAFAAGLVGFR